MLLNFSIKGLKQFISLLKWLTSTTAIIWSETNTEYKLFHILGADAVGMSTVPEVIVANHCGIKVFGISVITDLGVEGKIVEVTHEEVQKAADAAQPKMTTIMRELINRA